MKTISIQADLSSDIQVEEVTLTKLRDRGWDGVWGENDFWWQIMTVLFWDEIFADIDGVRIARDMPTDLFKPTFYKRREKLFENRIDELGNLDIAQEFQEQYNRHHGTPARPVEEWDMFEPDDFENVLNRIDKELLLEILQTLLRDFNDHRRGLPDLVLWKDGNVAFGEVKGPSDSLREGQKRWLSWLEELGANTFMIHVEDSESESIDITEDTFDQEIGEFEPASRESETIDSDVEPPEYSHDLQAKFKSNDDQDDRQAEKDWDQVEEIMTNVVQQQVQTTTLENDILVLLFPYDLLWEEFDEWHDYFSQIGRFPYMWDGLEEKPDPISDQSQDILNELCFVSVQARRIFYRLTYFSGGKTTAKQAEEVRESLEMNTAEFKKARQELEGGLIKADLTIEDRLPFLRVKDLKPILEEYDLKKSGRKAELVERLAGNVPDDELKSYLPNEASGDLLKNSVAFPNEDDEALQYKKKKIELYLHTAQMTGYLERDLNRFESGSVIQVEATDDIPVCTEKAGNYELKEQNIEKLPPHFPGCRCSRRVAPESIGLKDGKAKNAVKEVTIRSDSYNQDDPTGRADDSPKDHISVLGAFEPRSWTIMGWIWFALGIFALIGAIQETEPDSMQKVLLSLSLMSFPPIIRYFSCERYSLIKQWLACGLLLFTMAIIVN